MSAEILYWSMLRDSQWTFYIAATAQGLCFVGSPGQHVDELAAWSKKRFPDYMLVRDEQAMQPYINELTAYLNGELTEFSCPVHLYGTPFQLAVWHALRDIPYGRTCSYSDIAERIENPEAVRAVGAAIGANPLLIIIPCHRVVGKNGSLTGYRGGLEMKKICLSWKKQFRCAEWLKRTPFERNERCLQPQSIGSFII
ncbi:methylated-DNA--[protein]-cysteine S-methyltransferase [Bacillus sonorensis]|uniref:methylated-DNA--[protein]-cysteine S-methyltransferase n=1 Tax=Bacillus sonorensis TaxID=119858 RepID=UPI00228268F5|nr:methylated-DNA--[protein]-cysteine S-methyltransferase [Bacillus sonorensis]MCY8034989.1 methylated-DNA--[protein]-cysteine S-methyltransferase [Bacillus sonorensis]